MSQSITISYDLHPPTSTSSPAPSLTPSKSQRIPVNSTLAEGEGQHSPLSESNKSYYESLRGAISEAKTILGGDLTAWRDAVGSGELLKENKRTVKEGEDLEEDVEAEDEE